MSSNPSQQLGSEAACGFLMEEAAMTGGKGDEQLTGTQFQPNPRPRSVCRLWRHADAVRRSPHIASASDAEW
jgi:hypothetical protein